MANKLLLAIVMLALSPLAAAAPELARGFWKAWLDTPGGELPFAIEFVAPLTDDKPGGFTAAIFNGAEKIEIPVVRWEGNDLLLDIDYYDAHLRATLSEDGKKLEGEFTKQRATSVARMPFHARSVGLHSAGLFLFDVRNWKSAIALETKEIHGKWRVSFADDADGAVAVITEPPIQRRAADPQLIQGTFLTPTGDYRYLEGVSYRGEMRLSCFDGAHAFLFAATLQPDGSLKGDFWSGNWGHDTWTAVRDESAALPDAFTQVKPKAGGNINALSFPDLDGKTRSLSEPALGGGAKCRLYYVFGSWCPNCKDCTAYLNELLVKYEHKGLTVTGLSFEVTGDRERDARQARLYTERAHVQFPVLLAGKSDRKLTGEALAPVLESFKAWPTVMFVDRTGKIRAVYTGFSGPATGEENAKMRRQWEKIIEGMLAE